MHALSVLKTGKMKNLSAGFCILFSESLPDRASTLPRFWIVPVSPNHCCRSQGPIEQMSASGSLHRSVKSLPVPCHLQVYGPALGSLGDKHVLPFLMPQQYQGSPRVKGGRHVKQTSDYIPLGFFSLCDWEDQEAITKAKPMVFRACSNNNNLTHA